MTLGRRIAQKRKELGLSQEGLGEQLGVSRQAIYKWESDATLPEIDKLITLSRIFSVSVGWLLGVEEAPQVQSNSQKAPGELTEAQLAMVQEIVDRYLAAQPKPVSPKRRRLFRLCAAAAALALVAVLFNLFSKLDQVNRDFNGLYLSMNNVSSNVNSQIGSITRRVEDILKSQNSLTAEWSTELAATDPKSNTATFRVRVVPKTYVEGMSALFQARSGDETLEQPIVAGVDHAFTGEITCPLTDSISLTAVLLTGDKRETQWLEDYYDLYSQSFPQLTLHSSMMAGSIYNPQEKAGVLPASGKRAAVEVWKDGEENHFLGWNPDPPVRLQVGLFREQKLVMWYEGRTATVNWNGVPTEEFAWFRTQDVVLDPDVSYYEAAVYTDAYGRQKIYCGTGLTYHEGVWEPAAPYIDNLEGWEF